MRLALAQLNVVVGDLDGNRELIVGAIREARAGADLVVFPELAVTGYPPEDLLLRPGFIKAARTSLDEIAGATEGITALVGCPLFERDLANACAVLSGGEIRGSTASSSCRTTASSTSTATSPPAATSSCSAAATSSSARRSARTSGSPVRRRPISPSPAPS